MSGTNKAPNKFMAFDIRLLREDDLARKIDIKAQFDAGVRHLSHEALREV